MRRRPPWSPLFPYTTLFRSVRFVGARRPARVRGDESTRRADTPRRRCDCVAAALLQDRKSTRLNSSHVETSYAVFCLKKKTSDAFASCFALQEAVREITDTI